MVVRGFVAGRFTEFSTAVFLDEMPNARADNGSRHVDVVVDEIFDRFVRFGP